MRSALFVDASGLDGRTIVLWRDAVGFLVTAARSDQVGRRAVAGDMLFLARLRRQRRLHKQLGVVVRVRRL